MANQLTARQRKQLNRSARQVAKQAAGSSRVGVDDAGRQYSKDAGTEIGRNRGVYYVGPDGEPMCIGTPGTEVWSVTDWRRADRCKEREQRESEKVG